MFLKNLTDTGDTTNMYRRICVAYSCPRLPFRPVPAVFPRMLSTSVPAPRFLPSWSWTDEACRAERGLPCNSVGWNRLPRKVHRTRQQTSPDGAPTARPRGNSPRLHGYPILRDIFALVNTATFFDASFMYPSSSSV